MYGSSLTRETLILRDSRIAAREAAAMPLPREETTPPVTNTYLVILGIPGRKFVFYRNSGSSRSRLATGTALDRTSGRRSTPGGNDPGGTSANAPPRSLSGRG